MNRTLSLAIALTLPLAGCISFGAKPPKSLLTLSAATPVPVGAAQDAASAKSIVIDVPSVPQSLATARIPVQVTPTSLAYVPDAIWAEPPNRLFARLLSDTVTARSGRVVVSTVQAIGDPSAQLAGELRNFGIDAATRTAVVTYDAALTRAGASTIDKRRFEARVPVPAIDATSASIALNDAANQVAVQVADWVGR
jgi:cholesterol transport system auxiliary component